MSYVQMKHFRLLTAAATVWAASVCVHAADEAGGDSLSVESWRLNWSGEAAWSDIEDRASQGLRTLGAEGRGQLAAENRLWAAILLNRRGIARLCLSEQDPAGQREKRLALARDDFQSAIRLFEDGKQMHAASAAHSNLGMSLRLLGETGKAREAYQRAIGLDAGNGWAYNNLGWLRFSVDGKAKEAAEKFEEADRLGCPQAPVNLACLYLSALDSARAAERLREVLDPAGRFRSAPRAVQQCAHLNLGEAYRIDGRLGDALAEYEKAVALNPRDAAAWLRLGAMQLATGRFEAAAISLQGAYRHYEAGSAGQRRACLLACIAAARASGGDAAKPVDVRACVERVCTELKHTWSERTWEGFLLAYLAGDVPEEELRAQLSDKNDPQEQARGCEAYYVMGQRARLSGDTESAGRCWSLAVGGEGAEVKPSTRVLLEYSLAQAERAAAPVPVGGSATSTEAVSGQPAKVVVGRDAQVRGE